MRQSLARFSASVSSFHASSWADFITTTLAFRFSVHTPRMTELRSLIEAKALEWAIPKMSKADLEKATRILAELDKAKSTDRIIALNARFHEALYAPARKDRTLAIVANLRMNFERYLRFTWQETHHLDQPQKEHRQILALCVARDVERACTLLRQHILGTGSLLVERLQSHQPG